MAILNNVMTYTAEKLNDRVAIHRAEVTTDSEGNRIKNYGLYKELWANVEVIGSVNTGESGSEVKRIINYSIVLRYPIDIKESDRVVWNGAVLYQTSPAVTIGRKFVVLSCKDLVENG